MPKDRRVTFPVLLVLLAFLGGAAYLVYDASEDAQRADSDHRAAGDQAGHARGGAPGSEGWRHHDWAASGPAEGSERTPRPSADVPHRAPDHHASESMGAGTTNDEVWDPQMSAMRRSFRIVGDAGVALPFSPVQRTARIVDSEGTLAVGPNASCEVRVLPVQTSQFNCLVRVICDGHVLYPNATQTAGYAPCDVENGRAMSALDDGHTAADGDPLVRVDLRAGTVTVEDRGDGVAPFRATLRVGPTS